jgi:NADH dehydrogenase
MRYVPGVRILVTGGTGVIGSQTVAALLRHGHDVRLYSRHASEHAKAWPSERVTACDGGLSEAVRLRSSLRECQAVIHLAGIVSERGADQNFQTVNVEGTRRVTEAADEAGVPRFVYVSSLGAERGRSKYHESKRKAERHVSSFAGQWVVLRPGNVYGPRDEVISLLLKMMRVLPIVPVIDGGDHEFQPIWVEDLAEALALSVSRDDVVGRYLELAGPERTSMNDLIDRFREITGRSPARVPLPGFLSLLGARAAGLLGLHIPLDAGQIQMLEEGNVIANPEDNAMSSVFSIQLTSLDTGLRRLADALAEQTPDQGVGSLVRRHVWADIDGSRLSCDQLFQRFCARFKELTPWHVQVGSEPDTPNEVRLGATLTMHLPLRGNVQVRVVELDPSSVTLATIEGHPLCGLVRFRLEDLGANRLRFHVEVHDRPWNIADWLVMSTVGGMVQVATWRSTVEHLVEESGGRAVDGVHDQSETLHGLEARRVEQWAAGLIEARRRALHTAGISEASVVPPREGAGAA